VLDSNLYSSSNLIHLLLSPPATWTTLQQHLFFSRFLKRLHRRKPRSTGAVPRCAPLNASPSAYQQEGCLQEPTSALLQWDKHASPRSSARLAKLLAAQHLRVLRCQTAKKQLVMRQPPPPHAIFMQGTNPQAYHAKSSVPWWQISSHLPLPYSLHTKEVSTLDLLNTVPFMWISLQGSEEVPFISQAALKTILFSKQEFYTPFIIPVGICIVSSSFS